MQNPGTDFLAIRARAAADLDALREHYLPDLSETASKGGADYPYRATCSHADFAAAQVKIALAIDYSNFRNQVAAAHGERRARV